MSRHGYVDYGDFDNLDLGRWRGQVASAIRGVRGQEFLRELAAAMDAMPDKVLIAKELINSDGDCCTIGVVCKARGLDVSKIDYTCPEQVGGTVGIAKQMAAEIEYENDEFGGRFERMEDGKWRRVEETPAERWKRMRAWVESKLKNKTKAKENA